MTGSLRSCVYCGVAFAGTARALYCSQRCKNRVYDERHREQRRAYARQWYRRQPRPPGTAPPPRTCAQCGQAFTPGKTWGRYCSDTCRQRAFRQRQAE
jgi:predicted nucleic acid-binding Zn ribbon protein